ncbi:MULTISPECIES: HEXXH motif-containing putative peptide modification protein [unclassified Streptomyces]|uniref:aKG-HExxH-type peptide beta-hydroxylase n=1 Tax=unclassified Streptomyces TaxID=2593676 RepID=UPI00224E32E8|nr:MULTISPECIES: HEXXH motif-containing putative peptide modification protein [unclassified Streptomyces]MCX5048817.1 HEXXH motif-containing putative peptide modification protein [Streptomyces sp. NBC_00474]
MHHHHLSDSALRALLSTTEDEHAVAELLDAEVSRRLLLLRAVLDASDDVPEAGPAGVREAWRLLEDAEKLQPAGFRTALLDPQVGLWAASVFRRLSRVAADAADAGDAAPDEPPLHAELGFLSLLAASVSLVAGADFRVRVPVWQGAVFLPGLGRALVGGEAWGWAEVEARDGVATVTADGARAAVTADGARTTVTPDGALATVAPAGGRAAVTADGAQATVAPDGVLATVVPDGAQATVTADGAWAAVTADVAQATVTLPVDPESDGPGWQGLRRLRSVDAGTALTLTLTLDDLGPYPAVPGLQTSGRLSPAQFACWQRWFDEMWPVLATGHPAAARALSVGLLSVVPLPRGERLRARAASSSDAFGCVLLSEPDDDAEWLPAQLGVALVHEFRHTLLNGLIFLTPLFDECGELFHAPWRDDPRPLGGLVHGAYAFSGVAHYWRTRGADGLAGFEFALWRSAVQAVLETLRDHPALTPLGRDLVKTLDEQTAPWHEEPAGTHEHHLAHLAATHHHATWRAHHLHTPSSHAKALARAWEAGGGQADAPDMRPVLRTDPGACRLDALALLARLSIIAPQEFDALRAEEEPARLVPGVGVADLALVGGDAEAAVKLYVDELADGGARPAAWAGLGLALSECGETAAGAVLTEQPELALGVSRLLPTPPDPVALARWLAYRPVR